MQKLSLAGLVASAFIATAALVPGQVQAVPLATVPGSLATVDTGNSVEQVRYVCRRVWRCNRWGCGWRRTCSWRPSYYGYRAPYYGFYYGAPRRSWNRRHCHWRHGRRVCYWR